MVEHCPGVRNRVLAALPLPELTRILPFMQRVELRRRQILVESGIPISFVHFVEQGLVCGCSRPRRGSSVEVAMVGNMGLVGTPVVLGSDRSPYRAVVQIPGQALRLRTTDIGGLLETLPAFRRTVLRYVNALMVQQSQIVVCNARHLAVQRASRWILMTLDRIDGDSIPIGQDLVARMLGLRRPTITDVMSALRAEGLIRYERLNLTVVDRAGLEARACECYAVIAAEYARMQAPAAVSDKSTAA